MHRFSRWAWLFSGLASIALATWAFAKDPTPTDLGEENVKRFNKNKPEFAKLVKGEKQNLDSDDKKKIELAAQVLVWRVSWPLTPNTNPKIMDAVRKEFEKEINDAMNKDNRDKNKDFRKLFAKYLIGCFKDVFNLPFDENKVGCVNAALLLPKLARLEEEEIGDYLAELVKDPKKHDAIKLYALKGLAAYFPAHEWTVAGDPADPQRKKREIDRIKVVMDFLERKWDPTKAEDDAIRFMRREAIKTLGQAQVPAVEVKDQKVVAPVAYGLLKILEPKNGMKPSPSLQEKVEATIGICQIKIIPNSDYIPDRGIYLVGTFLRDFADEYKKDKPGIAVKKIPSIPWKIQGERLTQALKVLVKNTDLSPYAQKTVDLQKETRDLLTAIKNHSDVDTNNIKDLGTLVTRMRPKNAEIFKGIKPPNGD